MSMFEDYIQNLVKERIPMPNSWQKSMALEVLQTKQDEFAIEKTPNKTVFTEATAERTGYTFLDKLQRGYISHNSRSFEYTEDTQYLLGMYLRALKYHKGKDFLSIFNCVVREVIDGARKRSYIPVVIGETYSLFVQATSYVGLTIQNSLTGDIIKTIQFEKTANNAFLIRTDDLQIDVNLEEYLQIVVDTEKEISVTALIGVYSTIPSGPIYSGVLSAKVPDGVSNYGFTVANYPSLSQAYEVVFNSKKIESNLTNTQDVEVEIKKNKYYADKLEGCMLGTSISDKSNKAVRQSVLLLYGGDNISETIKRNTPGLYDIDGNSDKRFPTQGV